MIYRTDYKQLTKTEDDFALLFNLNKRSLWLYFASQRFSNQAIGQQFIRSSSIVHLLKPLASFMVWTVFFLSVSFLDAIEFVVIASRESDNLVKLFIRYLRYNYISVVGIAESLGRWSRIYLCNAYAQCFAVTPIPLPIII